MSGLLVHICCAPDALYFLKRLREDYPDKEIVGFFYDPNIHPYEEYRLRLIETRRICRELNIKLIEGEYDVEDWMTRVKGLECEPERGERCSVCFDFRLERSAIMAKELGIGEMTTTLLMSPKKRINQLRESGERTASRYGVKFLTVNYRKGGGTQEMFRLSKERELYQQDYCGCIYGLFQQKEGDIQWDLVGFGGRPPGSREETLFIKEIRDFAESESLEVKELEFPFLGWRVIEGGLWVGDRPISSIVVPYSQSIRGKVRADAREISPGEIVLSKQFVRIYLCDALRDEPLSAFSSLTYPTFRVPRSERDGLLSGRVTAVLKTEFMPMRSRVLIIGNCSSEVIMGIPADTLQDLRGWTLSDIRAVIEDNTEGIKSGKKALVLMGACSLCFAGKRFVEDHLGRDVVFLGYP